MSDRPASGHFTLLVYPFRHAVSGAERLTRLIKLNACWRPWWSRLDGEALVDALDDTYYFLPYLRKLLFPETTNLPEGDAPAQKGGAEQLARLPLGQLAARLPQDSMFRLTYDPRLLALLQPLQLRFSRDSSPGSEEFRAGVRLGWIDAVIFPHGVGFLVMRLEIEDGETTVERLADLLYYVRTVQPPTSGWQLACWVLDRPGALITFESRELVDYLLQGLIAGEAGREIDASLDTFLQRLRHAPAGMVPYTSGPVGQVYGQTFRQFSYACLSEPSTSSPMSGEEAGTALPLFSGPVQQALYELATATPVTPPDSEPHPSEVARIMGQAHLAFWSNWEALALHDNVVFLGTHPTPFTLNSLPNNVESDYFHLYLLALYQKIRLSLLAGDAMREGLSLHRNLREARTLWDGFIMFRNHYWFAEVTLKPQGNEIYRSFHAGLGVDSLFRSVEENISALQLYYENKDQRHIGAILNFGAFVGLPTLGLGLLHDSGIVPDNAYLVVALLVYAVALAGWVLWSYLGRG